MVDARVVEEQDDVLLVVRGVLTNAMQHLLDEVLKDSRVHAAFDELVRDNVVLADSANEANTVVLPAHGRLTLGHVLGGEAVLTKDPDAAAT